MSALDELAEWPGVGWHRSRAAECRIVVFFLLIWNIGAVKNTGVQMDSLVHRIVDDGVDLVKEGMLGSVWSESIHADRGRVEGACVQEEMQVDGAG